MRFLIWLTLNATAGTLLRAGHPGYALVAAGLALCVLLASLADRGG